MAERTATTVTVSPKFQIVIPKSIREKLGLQPGQRLVVIQHEDTITLVPRRPISSLRGFVAPMDLSDVRDRGDRF